METPLHWLPLIRMAGYCTLHSDRAVWDAHVHTHSHKHTHICTHMHTHMHTHAHTHAHTHSHTCTHIHIHTHAHTHSHTHTYIHIRTHTQTVQMHKKCVPIMFHKLMEICVHLCTLCFTGSWNRSTAFIATLPCCSPLLR